ncbi:MAG: hypothetical protein AAFO96_03815 [Bacteroidota bacterium]
MIFEINEETFEQIADQNEATARVETVPKTRPLDITTFFPVPEEGEVRKYYFKVVAPDPQMIEAYTGIPVDKQQGAKINISPVLYTLQGSMKDPVLTRTLENGQTVPKTFMFNSDQTLIPGGQKMNDKVLTYLQEMLEDAEGFWGAPEEDTDEKVSIFREIVRRYDNNGKIATYDKYNRMSDNAIKSTVKKLMQTHGVDQEKATQWANEVRNPNSVIYQQVYNMRIIPVDSKLDEEGNSVPLRSYAPIMRSYSKDFFVALGLATTEDNAPRVIAGSFLSAAFQWQKDEDTFENSNGIVVTQEGHPSDILANLIASQHTPETYDLVVTVEAIPKKSGKGFKAKYTVSYRKVEGQAIKTTLNDPNILDEENLPSMMQVFKSGAEKQDRVIDAFATWFGDMSDEDYENKWLKDDDKEEKEEVEAENTEEKAEKKAPVKEKAATSKEKSEEESDSLEYLKKQAEELNITIPEGYDGDKLKMFLELSIDMQRKKKESKKSSRNGRKATPIDM